MADITGITRAAREPEPQQSWVVSALYVLYFAPLIWVLAEHGMYPTAAPATVLGVTAAHFVAGLLETWPDVAGGARRRYLGRAMWLNIAADVLITSAFTLSTIAIAETSLDDTRITLAAAICATVGNLLCVAGRVFI